MWKLNVLPYGLKRETGQIAALLLLVMSVMFFLGSIGIFYAQKKYFQTKAKVAADAGAMYLNSIVGSYAHYLACKYLKCKCKKKKKRWGAIIGLSLGLLGGFFGGLGVISLGWALAMSSTGLAKLVQDELTTKSAVKKLKSAFKKLSDVNDVIRWSTISYVAHLLADPEVIPQLELALASAINGVVSSSGDKNANIKAVSEAIKKELVHAYWYGYRDGSHWIPSLAPYSYYYYYHHTTWLDDLLEALSLWEELAGTSINQPGYYTENVEVGDGAYPGLYNFSAFDYIRAVMYGAGANLETSLAGLMRALMDKEIDGIQALAFIKDWDPIDPDDEGGFYQDLKRIKAIIDKAVYTVKNTDLKGKYVTVSRRTFGGRIDVRHYAQVRYLDPWHGVGAHRHRDGVIFMGGGSVLSSLMRLDKWLSKGYDARIYRDDYDKFKEKFIRNLVDFSKAIAHFMSEVDRIINKYQEPLAKELGINIYSLYGNSFKFSWVDKLGRHHSLGVSLYFKLPKIKVKKSLFKVKVKLKRCEQTVWVVACRNGYCFRTYARYHAKKHRGPTTYYWWIKGR